MNIFKSMGHEGLDGLDRSNFERMTDDEKDKSFNYLLKEFKDGSVEAVDGLQALADSKIYDVFLKRIIELKKEHIRAPAEQ